MSPQLPRAVNEARRAVAEVLDLEGLNLVACSGGADSLALAAAAAFHHSRGTARVGAVVVDHRLHPDSAAVTATALTQLTALGLDPVISLRATVQEGSAEGPEAAARTARYQSFTRAREETGARIILLAHTRDDQAEQVLLGLARGSGTRSLAGIPRTRGPYRRPLLDLTREDTEAICAHAGLSPWRDPSNQDSRFLRSRVRTEVLPFLEEQLGPGIREALARTARVAAEDADYLEAEAKQAFSAVLHGPDERGALSLPIETMLTYPPAIRRRVLALAIIAAGGKTPSQERLYAVEKLLEKQGSAGPVQLEGHISARRGARSTPEYGKLVFVPHPPG